MSGEVTNNDPLVGTARDSHRDVILIIIRLGEVVIIVIKGIFLVIRHLFPINIGDIHPIMALRDHMILALDFS